MEADVVSSMAVSWKCTNLGKLLPILGLEGQSDPSYISERRSRVRKLNGNALLKRDAKASPSTEPDVR